MTARARAAQAQGAEQPFGGGGRGAGGRWATHSQNQ